MRALFGEPIMYYAEPSLLRRLLMVVPFSKLLDQHVVGGIVGFFGYVHNAIKEPVGVLYACASDKNVETLPGQLRGHGWQSPISGGPLQG
jgi:hypothetical protein